MAMYFKVKRNNKKRLYIMIFVVITVLVTLAVLLYFVFFNSKMKKISQKRKSRISKFLLGCLIIKEKCYIFFYSPNVNYFFLDTFLYFNMHTTYN